MLSAVNDVVFHVHKCTFALILYWMASCEVRCSFFCVTSVLWLLDEAEGPDSCAKVDRMRLCRVGAAAVLATNLSLRLSLSSIQLPGKRGLPHRPADNTRWTAKWTLGFHGIPAVSRACKKQRYEAIKRSWAAIGRRSP